MRREVQAEFESTIHPQRHAFTTPWVHGCTLKPCLQGFMHVLFCIPSLANGYRIALMGLRRRNVLAQACYARLKSPDLFRQLLDPDPGHVLLVGVVLLQDMQPLDLGVRLGEGEHCGVARSDSLNLGTTELLVTDVLGLAYRKVAGHDLVDKPGF